MQSFRQSSFRPLQTTSQIFLFTSLYYFLHSTTLIPLLLLSGSPISLDYIFNHALLQSTATGFMLLFHHCITSVATSYLLLKIIKRAKLCLDFSATLIFIHFISCWTYQHAFPSTALFYIACFLDLLIMSLGGEYLCMRQEMEPIALNKPIELNSLT